MSGELRSLVLRSYKRLIRTCHTVFKNDLQMLTQAKSQAHQMFADNRQLNNPEEIKKLVFEADDASEFMRRNIVQLEKDPKSNRHKANIERRHLRTEEGDFIEK